MPCIDDRTERDLPDSKFQQRLAEKMKEQERERQIRYLKGALCALLTEISAANLEWLISKAEQNGKVNIHSFWAEHNQDDTDRIKKDLDKYSEHEKELIKKILTE